MIDGWGHCEQCYPCAGFCLYEKGSWASHGAQACKQCSSVIFFSSCLREPWVPSCLGFLWLWVVTCKPSTALSPPTSFWSMFIPGTMKQTRTHALHDLKVKSWRRRRTCDGCVCWHVYLWTMCGWTCVDNVGTRQIPKQQHWSACLPCWGEGGSGYCWASSQLCCPGFTLPDSLWRQRLWSGSRVSVLGLSLWGIGGLNELLESSWHSSEPWAAARSLPPRRMCEWVSARTQPRRA